MVNKAIISAALVCTLAAPAAASAADAVDVYVNGKIISARGYIEDDTTYVPIRAVSEAMGAEVGWDGESVRIERDEESLTASIVENMSESVVAVVGNYKTDGSAAAGYNENTAHGTGVVIKSNGLILTNAHVVQDISNITVVFSDGESYAGTVECIDKTADLATVKINRLGLKPVTFKSSSADLKVGNTVIAIGTPISLSMRNSATKGIISGMGVDPGDSYYPLLQTDAAINPGNSGGPLVDLTGAVVGINSSKYAALGVEGMAFSIPVETINYVLGQFEKNGKVLRPEIKATFDESWEARIGLPTKKGITAKVTGECGLQNGDIVKAVNGVEVHSITDYNKAVRDTFTDKLVMTVERGGNTTDVEVSYELK